MKKCSYLMCMFIAAMFLMCAAQSHAAVKETPAYLNTKLSWDARAMDLVSRMTNEEKVSLMNNTAYAVPRFGIKPYQVWNEALHGVLAPGFTVFPMAVAMASTWNPDLIHAEATAISDEAWGAINRDTPTVGYPSSRFLTFWSPTINMSRDPRWGRTPESYGEDPYLTGRIAVAFVRGLQGDDKRYIKCVSTPKHFAANNEEHNRLYGNAWISEKTLREYYFPAFKTAIQDGGAISVMGAYNAVNFVPSNANRWLLTDLLRDEWGFKGFVVTDCDAGAHLWRSHKYARNEAEAATLLLKAGVDVECNSEVMRNSLLTALRENMITEDELNLNVTRLLKVRFMLGMFDPPEMNPYTRISPAVIGSPAHVALARRISRESIVLLKNEKVNGKPLLPLNRNGIKTIAVVGPYAAALSFGGYSGKPINIPVNPLQGIIKKIGGNADVKFVEWFPQPLETKYRKVPEGVFTTPDGSDAPGLAAEYFNSAEFTGEPAARRVEANINAYAGNLPSGVNTGGPVSVRWRGIFKPEKSGGYFFFVTGKSGASELFVDGKSIMKFARAEKSKLEPKTGATINVDGEGIVPQVKKAAFLMLEGGKPYVFEIRHTSENGAPAVKLDWVQPTEENIAIAQKFFTDVRSSDMVVAFMGIGDNEEREGRDRDTLDLPSGQTEYVEQLMRLNGNVVVVLVNGSPLSINRINEIAPAILETWYPGEQGGNAIADVLFGDYNPAGRLTMTFFKSDSDLPAFNDYEISHGRTYMYFDRQPLFPFGYGLSYTTFGYSGIRLDKSTARATDKINVTFNVKNTGGREGDEVVQLYVRDTAPKVKRPLKRLRGFQRIHINKGESKSVTLPLAIKDLAYWNEYTRKYEVSPGKYEIQVGASSVDIRLKAEFTVSK